MSGADRLPRLLAIMGSGETSPTMTGVHRFLLDRLGTDARAIVLDTPVGFQLNADEVTSRAVGYFRESLGRPLEIASFKDASTTAPADAESVYEALRRCEYVFAGPGSPTYALKQWRESLMPDLLREKLTSGGCLVFASAAALTLGRFAIPVYEIYKVGAPVVWEPGMDLVSEAALPAVVVPHFNNAEGGTHDTRYCYMGEPRLKALEEQLPDDTFIIGVDEHTACILDLDADTLEIRGTGTVTLRKAGDETPLEPGETLPLERLRAFAGGRGPWPGPARARPFSEAPRAEESSPFWPAVEGLSHRFDEAFEASDHRSAVEALLELDDHLWKWSHESFGTDELIRARSIARGCMTRLSAAAAGGAHHHRDVIAPFVEKLIEIREEARSQENWEWADEIRDALSQGGVEIRDEAGATEWLFSDD